MPVICRSPPGLVELYLAKRENQEKIDDNAEKPIQRTSWCKLKEKKLRGKFSSDNLAVNTNQSGFKTNLPYSLTSWKHLQATKHELFEQKYSDHLQQSKSMHEICAAFSPLQKGSSADRHSMTLLEIYSRMKFTGDDYGSGYSSSSRSAVVENLIHEISSQPNLKTSRNGCDCSHGYNTRPSSRYSSCQCQQLWCLLMDHFPCMRQVVSAEVHDQKSQNGATPVLPTSTSQTGAIGLSNASPSSPLHTNNADSPRIQSPRSSQSSGNNNTRVKYGIVPQDSTSAASIPKPSAHSDGHSCGRFKTPITQRNSAPLLVNSGAKSNACTNRFYVVKSVYYHWSALPNVKVLNSRMACGSLKSPLPPTLCETCVQLGIQRHRIRTPENLGRNKPGRLENTGPDCMCPTQTNVPGTIESHGLASPTVPLTDSKHSGGSESGVKRDSGNCSISIEQILQAGVTDAGTYYSLGASMRSVCKQPSVVYQFKVDLAHANFGSACSYDEATLTKKCNDVEIRDQGLPFKAGDCLVASVDRVCGANVDLISDVQRNLVPKKCVSFSDRISAYSPLPTPEPSPQVSPKRLPKFRSPMTNRRYLLADPGRPNGNGNLSSRMEDCADKIGLYYEVMKACDTLVRHKNTENSSGVKLTKLIGIDHLVSTRIVPPLTALLSNGLRVDNIEQRGLALWLLCKESVLSDCSTEEVKQVMQTLVSNNCLSTSMANHMKTSKFIGELTRDHLLDVWLHTLCFDEQLIKKYYVESSAVGLARAAFMQLFDLTLQCLRNFCEHFCTESLLQASPAATVNNTPCCDSKKTLAAPQLTEANAVASEGTGAKCSASPERVSNVKREEEKDTFSPPNNSPVLPPTCFKPVQKAECIQAPSPVTIETVVKPAEKKIVRSPPNSVKRPAPVIKTAQKKAHTKEAAQTPSEPVAAHASNNNTPISNLHRQPLIAKPDISRPKPKLANVAKTRSKPLNSKRKADGWSRKNSSASDTMSSTGEASSQQTTKGKQQLTRDFSKEESSPGEGLSGVLSKLVGAKRSPSSPEEDQRFVDEDTCRSPQRNGGPCPVAVNDHPLFSADLEKSASKIPKPSSNCTPNTSPSKIEQKQVTSQAPKSSTSKWTAGFSTGLRNVFGRAVGTTQQVDPSAATSSNSPALKPAPTNGMTSRPAHSTATITNKAGNKIPQSSAAAKKTVMVQQKRGKSGSLWRN